MIPRTHYILTLAAAALCVFAYVMNACAACAADLWVSAADPVVVTNNDCGQIVSVSGRPLIHRSFQTDDNAGTPANIADRISAGDELIVPNGARIEWITGANTVAVLGAGGRVRFDGLRSFAGEGGKQVSRLDVTLLAGEMRAQVRLNENTPEALFAALGGGEFLLARGDMEFFSGGDWRGAVVSGSASGRLRHGAMAGAPFAVDEGRTVGASGEARMADGEPEAIKQRVPFSFEAIRAALPPLPMMSYENDAP